MRYDHDKDSITLTSQEQQQLDGSSGATVSLGRFIAWKERGEYKIGVEFADGRRASSEDFGKIKVQTDREKAGA